MAFLLKTPVNPIVIPPPRRQAPRQGGTDPELLEETETLVQTRYAVQRLREMATTCSGGGFFGDLD
jgi:hypothetical protein